MARKPKPKKFRAVTEVKAIARERVGIVPAARPIEPKDRRKRPKYKPRIGEEQ